MSLYDDLGLTPGATADEIKHAYRRMASKHHPDRPGGDHQMMTMVQRAYDILGDAERRKFYDQHGVDKNEQPDLRTRALQQLQMSFMHMLFNNDDPADVEHEDLIAKLREMIRQGQASIPERKSIANSKIVILEKTMRRLKRNKKEGADVLSMMLEKQIAGIRVGISGLDVERQLGDEMLKVLEEYHTIRPR